ncbi:MAG: hypothetical protein CL678_02930 [Bdellovibrionaceae bacterium]|nr:hypothetical protein [Pseudobdellovibrionaceae bacterium]|tara:strand:+ start:10780 stop:11685 length:906 start_codon:yes stop_codon:yes gene_type:complete
MKSPKVILIMLNWNGHEETLNCLKSLEQNTYPNTDLILIDNGSTIENFQKLQKRLPKGIIPHRIEKNQGFAGGMNFGLHIAEKEKPDYVILLNNDTEVPPNMIATMTEIMEEHPKLSVLGPEMYSLPKKENETPLSTGSINLWTGTTPFEKKHAVSPFESCDFVHGCCFMVRWTTFKDIGFLDEDYYAYYEETDFCVKVKKSGKKLGVTPLTQIYHEESVSTKRVSGLLEYLMLRNRILFLEKNASFFQKIFGISYSVFIYGSKRALRAILYRQFNILPILLKGCIDGFFKKPVWSGFFKE